MPKKSNKSKKKVPSNHCSNVSENQQSQPNIDNVFLPKQYDSVFNTPKSLKQLSLTDFPALNKEIFKIPKKSKKSKKSKKLTKTPLSYAYMTKKYLPVNIIDKRDKRKYVILCKKYT